MLIWLGGGINGMSDAAVKDAIWYHTEMWTPPPPLLQEYLSWLCNRHVINLSSINANDTAQYKSRHENHVMCKGLPHDATRHDKNRALFQIPSNIRSFTTTPDFRCVVSKTPAHTIFLLGVILSYRVMCGRYNMKI